MTLAGWASQEKQFVIRALAEHAHVGTAGMPTMNLIKSPKNGPAKTGSYEINAIEAFLLLIRTQKPPY